MTENSFPLSGRVQVEYARKARQGKAGCTSDRLPCLFTLLEPFLISVQGLAGGDTRAVIAKHTPHNVIAEHASMIFVHLSSFMHVPRAGGRNWSFCPSAIFALFLYLLLRCTLSCFSSPPFGRLFPIVGCLSPLNVTGWRELLPSPNVTYVDNNFTMAPSQRSGSVAEQVKVERAPVETPPFTVGDLKRAVPSHCFERSYLRYLPRKRFCFH